MSAVALSQNPGAVTNVRAVDRLRTDIQALRGLAILLVVLQHSGLAGALKGGYLGVDIFFVVSGYLITGIVQRQLQASTFSFASFYLRRAKRLLPAAYATFCVTALLSTVFLTRTEMRDFAWQMAGAVTFTANIALWLQTGYFEGAAQLKPLLHVWSLSIEEQYYAVLPAALAFTPRRFWRAGIVAVIIASAVLCGLLAVYRPGAAFYLLPTRAWELALGSLAVVVLERSKPQAWVTMLFWPSVAALLFLPFFPTGAPHPGLDALMVCSATLVVILRRHPAADRVHLIRPVARLGDISYSLYLVHWPLTAFAANTWVSPVPTEARCALLILALAASWALYRWVEQPVRRAAIVANRSALGTAVALSGLLVAAVFAAYALQGRDANVDFTHLRRGNLGLDSACEFGEQFKLTPECSTAKNPAMLVWGDSYAMHLVGGIAATTGEGVAQATKTTCGPLLGVSVFRTTDSYSREWAAGCLRFSRSVMDFLATNNSVQVVVLSSQLDQYLAGNHLLQEEVGVAANRAIIEVSGSADLAAKQLADTVAAIRALGKRVVIVTPTPNSGVDVGRCLERSALGKVVIGADTPACEISQARSDAMRKNVGRLLRHVSRGADVPLVDLRDLLCRDGTCMTSLNGVPLYRDTGHLSVEGGVLLAQRLGLGARLMEMAR